MHRRHGGAAFRILFCALLVGVPPAAGQTREFDDSTTLALIRLAREYRQLGANEGAFAAYTARAEGHVYFFLDRDDGGEPIPMRVDQVAVDLYQDDQGRRRQVIRGLRKRHLLPIRDFRYYIDRLTAVQNGFGDRIAIGEARDVRDVPHPLGMDGEQHYHYRIADSTGLVIPTLPEPIRVYRVEVLPRSDDVPAFVGSVYLDARTGALARMVFSFTPASYRDPRVDRVDVRLEHRGWEGGLWLPYRQVVEVRREMPELDLPVGSVIRATLRVTDYEFDPDLPAGFFRRLPVERVAYGEADSTVYSGGLMDRMAEEGLSPISLDRIEAEARQAVRDRVTSGLPRLRLHANSFSSLLRVNRAEGLRAGAGASFSPRPEVRLNGHTGYATGTRMAGAALRGRWESAGASATTGLELYLGDLRDVGPRPGASSAVNSLSTLLRNLDYTDPYFATGGRVSMERALGPHSAFEIAATVEGYRGAAGPWSAGWSRSAPARPLRAVEEGVYTGARGSLRRRWGGFGSWSAEMAVAGTAGRWEGRGNGSVAARVEGRVASENLARHGRLVLEAGAAWGRMPPQRLYLLGGRGTLPGHAYRAYGGDRYLLARGEAALRIVPGWVTGRLLGGAGGVGGSAPAVQEGWGASASGLRGYVGGGVGLVHDILRIDCAWGFPDGTIEFIFSVDPRLRPFL